MTDDDIVSMASEAGLVRISENSGARAYGIARPEKLLRFAALVAAKEREACAQLCDTEWSGDVDTCKAAELANELAAAIRARGEPQCKS